MFTRLMLGAGVFWTVTYLLIIRRSFLDRTYGMPLVALCANISWEFLFSFVYPQSTIQQIINLIWFVLDVVILTQLLRYGLSEFANLPKRAFYMVVCLALATSFCVMLLFTMEFHDQGTYSAFGSNLLMSVLFIEMQYHRNSLRGQSISIAVCKLLGTALASLAFYFYFPLGHQPLAMPFLYISILIYDVIYVGLVYRHQRREAYKMKMALNQREMHIESK
jgi:hypothetical protein